MKPLAIISILVMSTHIFAAEGIPIDAVSSASRKYNLTSGTAYEEYAAIEWYAGYSNGQVFFSYGLEEGNYSETIEFNDVSRGYHNDTIRGLQPGSQYYFDLWTRYEGRDRHTCLGTFRTPESVVVTEGNPIDAVSSASRKYNLNGGTAYETHADIEWYAGYSNGQVFFSYGLEEGNYSETIEFQDVSRGNHKETITGLKPGSRYYFDLWTRYEGRDRHTCLGMFDTRDAVVVEEGNPIDAVSSASRKYNLNGGTAYETRAEIEWYAGYSNGQVFFSYGTQEGSYDNTIEFQDVSRGNHKETITDLTPNTLYHFDLWTRYEGRDRHTCIGTFQTTGTPTPISLKKGNPVSGILMFPTEKGVDLQINSNGSYTAVLYSLQGKKIAERSGTTTSSGFAELKFNGYAAGNYLIMVKSNGMSLSHKLSLK